MTVNVVMSEVDDLTCVVLSGAKKTCALWGIIRYDRMFNVITVVSQKPKSL